MMLALLIHAYCCGIYSSRKMAAATYDMIPFRVLTGDQHPHFAVINEFRLRHLDGFVPGLKAISGSRFRLWPRRGNRARKRRRAAGSST